MKTEDSLQKLIQILLSCKESIRYQPSETEVDYSVFSLFSLLSTDDIFLPYDKDSEPFAWATKCKIKFKNTNPYILIPGSRFDLKGTRHGRGGGWYDCFLSRVPKEWLRIGIASRAQISQEFLVRKEWDEPLDWLIVKDVYSWEVYETKARML